VDAAVASVIVAAISAVGGVTASVVSYMALRVSLTNSGKIDGVHHEINSRMTAAIAAQTAVGNLQGRADVAAEAADRAARASNASGP